MYFEKEKFCLQVFLYVFVKRTFAEKSFKIISRFPNEKKRLQILSLGKDARWSSSRPDWTLCIKLKKSSSGTVGASRGGPTSSGMGAGPPRWLEAGREDLCSSIRDPWHFISISKKDSSGNWSSLAVATLSLCRISGCLALLRPGRTCMAPGRGACDPGWPMRSKSCWGCCCCSVFLGGTGGGAGAAAALGAGATAAGRGGLPLEGSARFQYVFFVV